MEKTFKSDSRDNALEIVEAKDQSDHPYSKISSRMTKSVNRRPRSFRSGNKNIKSGLIFRNSGNSNSKVDKFTNLNEENTIKQTPYKNQDYLSKVNQLIKNYSGSEQVQSVKYFQKYPKMTRLTIDAKTNEIKRFKPKKVRYEKEKLYEEALEYKMLMNTFKEENIKLKTQLKQLQKQQYDNEVMAEEILNNQAAQTIGKLNKTPLKTKDSFLLLALKKQITELKTIIKERDTEIDAIKKNYKYTRINELEIDLKVYVEELVRMRNILDQVIKSRDPLSNPEHAKLIETELDNRNKALLSVQKENKELCEIIKEKQNKIQEQASTIQDRDKRIEKIKTILKEKSRSLISHKEKSRELLKVRNELLLLKSKTSGKGKAEVEQIIKSQQDSQKDLNAQISSKNHMITELKSEKKKLADKIVSLNSDIENLKKDKDRFEGELRLERNEEREKNIDLQKQFSDGKPLSQSSTKEKHSRPISANKHGRTLQEKQLQILADEVIEEQAELEPEEEANDINSKGEYNTPVQFKDIKHAILAIRFKLQYNKIDDLNTLSSKISMTLQEFATLLQMEFETNLKSSILIARFIFEEDSMQQNGKIMLNKDKSCLNSKIFLSLKTLVNLQNKLKPYKIFTNSEIEKLEVKLYSKIKKCQESFKETIKLDDEEQTGYTSYDSVMDALNVLDLGLEENELQLLFLKMFDPKRKENDNMHYATLFKWLNHHGKNNDKDKFDEGNENDSSEIYSDLQNKPIKESEVEEEFASNPIPKEHHQFNEEDDSSLTTEEKANIVHNALSKLAIGMRNKDKTVMTLFKTEKIIKSLHDENGTKQEYLYITAKALQDKLQFLNVNLSHQEVELLMESLSNSIIQGSILLIDLSECLEKLGIKENQELEPENNEKDNEYEQSFDEESVKRDNEVPQPNDQNVKANSNASENHYESIPDKRVGEDLQSENNELSDRIEHNSDYEEYQEEIDKSQPLEIEKSEGQDKHQEENFEEDLDENLYENLENNQKENLEENVKENIDEDQNKSHRNNQDEASPEELVDEPFDEYNESQHEKEMSENQKYEEEMIDDPEPEPLKAEIEENQQDEVEAMSDLGEKSVRIDEEPVKENENVDQFQQENENQITSLESNNSRTQNKGKPLDFSNILPLGVKILYNLTNYITDNPESNIFEEYVFIQVIQTKKRQNSVYLINAKDFFETLEIFGIITNPINPSQKLKMEQAKESVKDALSVNQINNDDDLQKIAIDASFESEDEDISKPPESKTLDCAKDIDEKLNDELFEEITPGRRPQEFEESEYANRSSIVVDKFYKNQGDYLHEDNEEYDNDEIEHDKEDLEKEEIEGEEDAEDPMNLDEYEENDDEIEYHHQENEEDQYDNQNDDEEHSITNDLKNQYENSQIIHNDE